MKTIEWATGLFEGEGHIGQRHLEIEMTDEDVIRDFAKVMGCGNVYDRERPGKHAWRWKVAKKEHVYSILESMLPHLGQRRAYKALNCLDNIDNIN